MLGAACQHSIREVYKKVEASLSHSLAVVVGLKKLALQPISIHRV